MNESIASTKRRLVDADGLLDALFEPACRPSIRWLREMQAQRKIPYIKMGHLVRFDITEVQNSLERHCTVQIRKRISSSQLSGMYPKKMSSRERLVNC